MGYTITASTLLDVLKSCEQKSSYGDWKPRYFTRDQGYALSQLVDVILPKTDTPSATEVNVHIFIDEMMDKVLPIERQIFLRKIMEIFMEKTLFSSKKDSLLELDGSDFVPLLDKYLAIQTNQEQKKIEQATNEYLIEIDRTGLDEDIACFNFAQQIRSMAIFAYKSSEHVGEKILAYLPIPGEYIPCGNVKEFTGGKAWSIG